MPNPLSTRFSLTNLIITLAGEKCPSWNTYYAGTHWRSRAAKVKKIHILVQAALRDIDPNMQPFEGRVYITFRAYFRSHPIDVDNLAAKLYIDGLKGWVIHDDNMKYMNRITLETYMDKENPRVEIEIKGE